MKKGHISVTEDCSLYTERQKEHDGKDRLKSDFLGSVLAS